MKNLSSASCLIILLLLPLAVQAAEPATPLSWSGYATGEAVNNFDGGAKRGTVFTAAGRIVGAYDTGVAHWWPDGTFRFGLLGIGQSHNQDLYTGAVQTPSNLSSQSELRISDLSYQHNFTNLSKASIGIIDIDDHFNLFEVANNLVNNAFSNTISLSANTQLATYPYPGFGAITEFGDKQLDLQLGIFQGNPQHQKTALRSGNFLIAELSSHLEAASNGPHFILKGGVWQYNPHSANWVGAPSNNGIYIITQATWATAGGKNLGAGLQFGANPRKINSVPKSIAACFTISNMFVSRPKDSLNFGAGKAWIEGFRSESFYELGYSAQLTDKIAFIHDVQRIMHPSGIIPNDWVIILRLSYTI